MGKIFKGQTKLQIKLSLEQDITDAKSVKIKFRKPSGLIGSWTATVINPTSGIIAVEPASPETLNETGNWVLWAYIVFSDGRVASGEPVTMAVNWEGK
jgi:hypothetical protein